MVGTDVPGIYTDCEILVELPVNASVTDEDGPPRGFVRFPDGHLEPIETADLFGDRRSDAEIVDEIGGF